jgi:hypothetical protein
MAGPVGLSVLLLAAIGNIDQQRGDQPADRQIGVGTREIPPPAPSIGCQRPPARASSSKKPIAGISASAPAAATARLRSASRRCGQTNAANTRNSVTLTTRSIVS